MNEEITQPNERAEQRASQVPAVENFQETPTATESRQSQPVVEIDRIDAPEFQPVQPNIARDTGASERLISSVNAQQNALKQRQEEARSQQTIQSQDEVERLRNNRQDLEARITGNIQGIADVQRSRLQMEEDAGIGELSQEVVEIQNQIDERDLFYRRQVEQIQGSGITMAQANARINSVQRERATELADLSIIENARLNRLDTAQALVDRKVQLKIQPLQTELEAFKFQFQANESLFTQAEGRRYQELVADKERKLTEARQDSMILEETKYQLLQNALKSGAPNLVLQDIQSSSSRQEAIRSAGKYSIDPMELEQIATAKAQRANIYSQIADREERFNLAVKAASVEREQLSGQADEERRAKTDKSAGIVAAARELANHPGLSSAVGPNFLTRGWNPSDTIGNFFTGAKSDFLSEAKLLSESLTLESMDLLSGPATDKDVEIVRDSVTKLQNVNISERDYKKHIKELEEAGMRLVKYYGIDEEQANYWFGVDNEKLLEVDAILGETPGGTNATSDELNPANYY